MALAKNSALPAAQQKRREVLASLAPAPAPAIQDPVPTPAAPAAQAPAPAPSPSPAPAPAPAASDDSVTLTRAEVDQLRADAADAARARRAAELALLDADDAKNRLTAVEAARKESAKPKKLDLGFDANANELTPQELDIFDEASVAFIRKIARQEIAGAADKIDSYVGERIQGVEEQVTNTAGSVRESNQRRFSEAAMATYPDIVAIFKNPKFPEFQALRIPMTDLTYDEAIIAAHRTEDMKKLGEILEVFRQKYGDGKNNTSGYAGASGSSALVEPTNQNQGPTFTMADRKRYSEDFRKGKITRQQLDEFVAKFNQANDEGRVTE